jgi:hypothetical protein
MSTKSSAQDILPVSSSANNTPRLRHALRANAVFSLVSGSLFLIGSNEVANFLGIQKTILFDRIPGADLLMGLGIVLLGFAGWVAITSMRNPIKRNHAVWIFAADAVWVIASILLLTTKALPFTKQGLWGVLIVADIVLVLAIWEFFGIRKMAKGSE